MLDKKGMEYHMIEGELELQLKRLDKKGIRNNLEMIPCLRWCSRVIKHLVEDDDVPMLSALIHVRDDVVHKCSGAFHHKHYLYAAVYGSIDMVKMFVIRNYTCFASI